MTAHCFKAFSLAVLIPILAAQVATAQNPTAGQNGNPNTVASQDPVSFEDITAKPNNTSNYYLGSMIRSDGFYARNNPLGYAVAYAYNVELWSDFVGLPGWATSENFDVIGKMVSPSNIAVWKKMPDDQKRRLVRGILEDRFGLRVHVETREEPIYALVVVEGGPKMQAVEAPQEAPQEVPQNVQSCGPSGYRLACGSYGPSGYWAWGSKGTMMQHATMQVLARFLYGLDLGRPVQDHTGLTGHYDFTLGFAPIHFSGDPEASPSGVYSGPGGPANTDVPLIFTNLQEQLGLKLEPGTGPVERYVIDHIERPLGN